MRRAREDDAIEEGIESAAKRARVESTGELDGERLFGELLLHFTQLGPSFTYEDWSQLTRLKKKFSGIGDGGEIYVAGWRALCFRDFESVVRTRDGRGPYQFLMNLEAHFIRRKLELPRGVSVPETWLRGYWRRAYVVCGHFVRDILDESSQSPFGTNVANFKIVGDLEVVQERLRLHVPNQYVEIDPRVTFFPWTDVDRRHLPVSMACAGGERALRVPIARVGAGTIEFDASVTYDPLVTVDEQGRDYTTDALRNVIVKIQHTRMALPLELPMGGATQNRPIRWANATIALGTIDVYASYGEYHPTLAIYAVDLELYWNMVFSHRSFEGSAFPTELTLLPDEWRAPGFEQRRRFMMGVRPMPLYDIVHTMYGDPRFLSGADRIVLFCRVPGYTDFWNALGDQGNAWLDAFDRIVMTEHNVIVGDPLRDHAKARHPLVIYKCRRCAGPAAFMVLETGEARCVNCAM